MLLKLNFVLRHFVVIYKFNIALQYKRKAIINLHITTKCLRTLFELISTKLSSKTLQFKS
jgi:hypothetical protein